MYRQLSMAAIGLAALCAGGPAAANLLDFDEPSLVVIDDSGDLASYTENGFVLSGGPASFLPLDASLVAGFDGPAPLSLKAVGGGSFALVSLDQAFFDLGFGEPPGLLTVVGLFNGLPVATQLLQLGASSSASFGASFGMLTEVSFSGSGGYSLDNLVAIPAVPEPATALLAAAGLLLLAGLRRNYGALRSSAPAPSRSDSSGERTSGP